MKKYQIIYADPPLTVNEAELIIRQLGNKPGCLFEGDPKDLIPEPEVENDNSPYN